jgi:hypothetical protein
MDAALPKQLRLALNQAAEEVIDYSAARFPRRTGAAAASLKARSTQREARVGLGGRRAPYAPWLVYGGAVGVNRSVTRLFVREGRDFGPYAALDARRDRIEKILSDALAQLGRDAGLEVT